MKLNVCCGKRILPDWTNVDIVDVGGKPDILADAREIPLDDGCADEIMCIHGVEHFHPWEAEDLFKEWFRLLKPGGKLVVELPNIRKCCDNLIRNRPSPKHPDQFTLWGLYGDPREKNPYMAHKWGWEPNTLTEVMTRHGFVSIIETETQWHATGKDFRDMRLEARKP